MGDLRVVIVTGANGFLGQACVTEARRRGLAVMALYRSKPLDDWAADTGISAHQVDLSQPQTLPDLPPNAGLIHCAGHLGDDLVALKRDTVEATRGLIEACLGKDIRFVMISSLAVYDTDALRPAERLDEGCPLVDPDAARDAYAGQSAGRRPC